MFFFRVYRVNLKKATDSTTSPRVRIIIDGPGFGSQIGSYSLPSDDLMRQVCRVPKELLPRKLKTFLVIQLVINSVASTSVNNKLIKFKLVKLKLSNRIVIKNSVLMKNNSGFLVINYYKNKKEILFRILKRKLNLP